MAENLCVKMGGGTSKLDFSKLTPHYLRATDAISGAIVGHRYLIALSWLNTSGSSKSYNGVSINIYGLTDIEVAKQYGDGVGHNSQQRARGAFVVGTATSTTITIVTNMAARACAIWLDLDE